MANLPKYSKGLYRITYHLGYTDTTQYSHLVNKDDFEKHGKVIDTAINEIKCLPKRERKKRSVELSTLKSELKSLFGADYFFIGSPLHEAIETGFLSGIIDKETAKKKFPCTIIRVDNFDFDSDENDE